MSKGGARRLGIARIATTRQRSWQCRGVAFDTPAQRHQYTQLPRALGLPEGADLVALLRGANSWLQCEWLFTQTAICMCCCTRIRDLVRGQFTCREKNSA